MKIILQLLFILASAGVLCAQTPMITDGLLMPKKNLGMGVYYGQDSWTNYWEGTLKRENGNVGKVSTQMITWMGVYGLSEKVNLIAMIPHVKTKASQGTLAGMKGIQDLTVAAKYNFFKKDFEGSKLTGFGVASFSTPLTDYTPDFLPLSIGLSSTTLSWRLTASYTLKETWFATASGAYTWRSNVKLDRPSYYTNDQFYLTDEVWMPNVFDYVVRAGYNKKGLLGELYFVQQNTLGGGDIRRQDMPFASNRMNASKLGASVQWTVPKLKTLALRAWGNYTVAGRNVGQSTSVMAGAMYILNFSKAE